MSTKELVFDRLYLLLRIYHKSLHSNLPWSSNSRTRMWNSGVRPVALEYRLVVGHSIRHGAVKAGAEHQDIGSHNINPKSDASSWSSLWHLTSHHDFYNHADCELPCRHSGRGPGAQCCDNGIICLLNILPCFASMATVHRWCRNSIPTKKRVVNQTSFCIRKDILLISTQKL